MNKEIERKWIVDLNLLDFDLNTLPYIDMSQGYISKKPTIRIRSENNQRFILCVKTKPQKDALLTNEYEAEIKKEEYENLLKKVEGNIITKRRYIYNIDGYKMEIDVFGSYLSPLCLAEIEFESEDEALKYKAPPFCVKDVSFDYHYKNAYLSTINEEM